MPQPVKDYYKILQLPPNATTYQIELAYEKLASQWHPDRHKDDLQIAEQKFKDINEAFEVLYNRSTRAQYDTIFKLGFTVGDAENTFEKFFYQNDFASQEERRLFNEIQEERKQPPKNYYQILGVGRDASAQQIKKAYRSLAIRYHPRNNGNSLEAQRKFVEVNEAYSVLSNIDKKQVHDDFLEKMVPKRILKLYDQFFSVDPFQLPNGQEANVNNLKKKWSRILDRMMECESDFGGEAENAETLKEATVVMDDNGLKTRKHSKIRRVKKQGKIEQVKIEEYEFPSGEREVRRTVVVDGKANSESVQLKAGDPLPFAD